MLRGSGNRNQGKENSGRGRASRVEPPILRESPVMNLAVRSWLSVGPVILVSLFLARSAESASTSVEQALELTPVQKGIEFDSPAAADVSKCTISAQRTGGSVGWVVKD